MRLTVLSGICLFLALTGLSEASGENLASDLANPGVKIFADRDYIFGEVPEPVRGLPFFRTSIEKTDVEVTTHGTLFALTPVAQPKAASQEAALLNDGFGKIEAPAFQLFPGELNRFNLYQKSVKAGERLKFKKTVLFVLSGGAQVRECNPWAPVLISNPGARFQDEARPGAMIIGMDRTPKGRIWGC